MNEKLAVIITGMNEWPRIQYTIRSVYEELRDRADFDIYYVDNFATDAWNLGKTPDESLEAIRGASSRIPELHVIEYKDHLSHWAAKAHAVENTDHDFFLFLDAHVIPKRNSLYYQWEYYHENHEELNGTLHMPTTYKILETHALQYKMHNELEKGWLGYSFTAYRHGKGEPYEVCAHTTDGCMMSRKVYDAFGGWPKIMQAWGGGENLFNFTLSILGMNKWILPETLLYHDGAPRGYSYNWEGLHLYNRTIAMYMIGGRDLARLYVKNLGGDPMRNRYVMEQVLSDPQVAAQRAHIEKNQKITIQEWVATWQDKFV